MHYIFQRAGIPPDEFMQKPRYVRLFMLKSMEVQIEAEAQEAAAQREREARRAAASRPRITGRRR